MKISIDKSRFALALLSFGAVLLLVIAIAYFAMVRSAFSPLVKVKLHAVPVHPMAVNTVTPTATPTAALKFYPTKGVIK